MQIVSWLEVGIHVLFPILVLGPCLAFTPMYALCLRPPSLKFLCTPFPCLKDTVFSPIASGLTNNYVEF